MAFDFDAIFYYVSDLDRAVPFYRDVLGFKFVSQDAVARFHIGKVLFELVPAEDANTLRGSGNARLCLKVQDIDAAIASLRACGVPTEDAQPKSNGILSSFHDPDEICLWQYA